MLTGLFALDWIAHRRHSGAALGEIGGTNQLTLVLTSCHKPYKYTTSKMRDQAVFTNFGLSELKIVKFIGTALRSVDGKDQSSAYPWFLHACMRFVASKTLPSFTVVMLGYRQNHGFEG
jgi:hypothetical protein